MSARTDLCGGCRVCVRKDLMYLLVERNQLG